MFMTYFMDSFGNLIEEQKFFFFYFLKELYLLKLMLVIEADKSLHLCGSTLFLIHVMSVRDISDQ